MLIIEKNINWMNIFCVDKKIVQINFYENINIVRLTYKNLLNTFQIL